MANYYFGWMKIPPKAGERFDRFEPEKYDCIPVADDVLESFLEKLSGLDCFWHSLNRPEKGLTWTGITLIPPVSLKSFSETLRNEGGTEELRTLVLQATKEQLYVIVFGV